MLTLIRRGVVAGAVLLSLWSFRSEACGCFATTTTSTPVVQAGERILFAVNQGVVTAHIQIQYAGDPTQFGWLLPLPSVPTLKVGSDQLFAQLESRTAPQFVFTLQPSCSRPLPPFACASPTFSSRGGVMPVVPSPLVKEGSVGPYEFAVLDASDQNAMLGWLNDNRYVIPNGTSGALGPYIHQGAYFLALKLQSGKSTGDLAPVVVSYASDAPMIPLVLTSVAAVPNMAIKVWLLGASRAVPRNFHHVVINDALINWQGQASNYGDLVTAAVAEAPAKHAFVTEYAGPSTVMRDVLSDSARYGNESDFAGINYPPQYLSTLFQHRFAQNGGYEAKELEPALKRILLEGIPRVNGSAGVSDDEFLDTLSRYFVQPYDSDGGGYLDAGTTLDGGSSAFDPVALTERIFREYVTPLREANLLFAQHSFLTRLLTTLSPEDMSEDPVFGFNPELPPVELARAATLNAQCDQSPLTTAQGWTIDSKSPPSMGSMPAAWKVEVLREEGQPEVVTDNTEAISSKLPKFGPGVNQSCSSDPFTLFGIAGLLLLRARRR